MSKLLFEQKISSKNIFKGEIVSLFLDKVKLPNKKIAAREKVSHPGAVGIVPVNKSKEIILIKQYRYPVGDVLVEIPAGKLDKNETPLSCARRELEEEIGAVGGKLIHLSTFHTSPGFCDEVLYLYLSIDFDEKENNLDDDEFLQIFKVKLEEGVELVKNKKIKDAKTIIGILMAKDYFNRNDR